MTRCLTCSIEALIPRPTTQSVELCCTSLPRMLAHALVCTLSLSLSHLNLIVCVCVCPVQLLLQEGADPNKKDVNGNTPLHIAVISNQLGIVTMLIKGGADLLASDKTHRTPLDAARSRLEIIRRSTQRSLEEQQPQPQQTEEEKEASASFTQEVLQMIEMLSEYSLRLGNKDLTDKMGEMKLRLAGDGTTSTTADAAAARSQLPFDELALALEGLEAITLSASASKLQKEE